MLREEVPQLVTVTVLEKDVPTITGPKGMPPALEPRHKAGELPMRSMTAAKPQTGIVFGAGGVTEGKKAPGVT
jgi:hypothetical protein